MIDAIRSYSSSHEGRLKVNNTSQQAKGFYSAFTTEGDTFAFSRAASQKKQSGLNSLFIVGGGAAAISLIIETIFSANELSKGNLAMVGDIIRHAAIMGVIGGACLAIFNLVEKNVFDKICK